MNYDSKWCNTVFTLWMDWYLLSKKLSPTKKILGRYPNILVGPCYKRSRSKTIHIPFLVLSKLHSLQSTTIFLLLTLMLVGCNDGSGDSGNPNAENSSDNSGNYLFYSGNKVSTGKLFALAPEIPSSPIVVEASNDIVGVSDESKLEIYRFNRGNYDSRTKLVSDYILDTLVYAKADGRFYKVRASRSGDLTPVQISNETEADQICFTVSDEVFLAEDFSDINQSQLVYSFPGADGKCWTSSDNTWKMIRLGMSPSDTPIDALHPLLNIKDLDSDASLSGWLVNDAGSLRRCDENFQNCSGSLTGEVIQPWVEFGLGGNNYLLDINNQIFVYNGDTNTISNAVFTLPQDENINYYAVDEDNFYFVCLSTIYRAPIDGSSVASVIGEEVLGEEQTIHDFSAMKNRLIYIKSAGTGNVAEIKALDKTGGTPMTLASMDGTSDVTVIAQNDRKIFYIQVIDESNEYRYSPLNAGILGEDGNIQFEAPNAAWIGGVLSEELDFGKSSDEEEQYSKLILVELSNGDVFRMSLRAFDAASGIQLIDLGFVPNLQGLYNFICTSDTQDDMLCEANFDLSSGPESSTMSSQSDIFYLNAAINGSLVRVTETPEISESILFFRSGD
ncbi:MAG: hypothetical protein P8171_19450 [Candidatus Thiodiazotropha sp.]